MTENQPTPQRIMQLATGCWATSILGAAADHALFTHLDSGADSAAKVASLADISERGAQTLLDGLVGLGLVELSGAGYRNSPDAAAFLVESSPASLTGFVKIMYSDMGSWSGLSDAVRIGKPVKDATAETAANPFWEELVPAIAPQSVPLAMIAADVLGLPGSVDLSILDVGGGAGVYSAVWLGLNPTARSTQLDWAPVNAIARQMVAERGAGDRFSCIDGDFHTTDFGSETYDVAVYSHIAHQEGPTENVAIFTRLRAALKPGGTLVISDFVVDDDRSGPPFPLIFASEMLLNTNQGTTWRRSDYQAWLAEAGFEKVTFQPTPTPATLIFAR